MNCQYVLELSIGINKLLFRGNMSEESWNVQKSQNVDYDLLKVGTISCLKSEGV